MCMRSFRYIYTTYRILYKRCFGVWLKIYIRKSGEVLEVPENAEYNGIRRDPTGLRRSDDVKLELTEPRFIVQLPRVPPHGWWQTGANGSENNWPSIRQRTVSQHSLDIQHAPLNNTLYTVSTMSITLCQIVQQRRMFSQPQTEGIWKHFFLMAVLHSHGRVWYFPI